MMMVMVVVVVPMVVVVGMAMMLMRMVAAAAVAVLWALLSQAHCVVPEPSHVVLRTLPWGGSHTLFTRAQIRAGRSK